MARVPHSDQSPIGVGDHVTVGKAGLTWEVVHIYRETWNGVHTANLRSGQTNRRAYAVPLHKLTLHTKGASRP